MEEGWEEVRLLSKGWKAGEELAEWWGDREQAYATKVQRARVAAEEELYRGEGQMNEAIRAADKLLHEISRLKNLHAKRKMLGASAVAREKWRNWWGVWLRDAEREWRRPPPPTIPPPQ